MNPEVGSAAFLSIFSCSSCLSACFLCVYWPEVYLFVTESQYDPGLVWFYGGIVCENAADERLLREAHYQ